MWVRFEYLRREELRNVGHRDDVRPLSNERLEITPDRKVKLQLKTPYSDGTTQLLFTFAEFIEKLMALVPPPKSHLVRWGGVFAPNSPVRKQITLKPSVKKGFQFAEKDQDNEPRVFKNHSWSKMLAKAFKIDVTTCDHCGGKLKKSLRNKRQR